MSSPPPRAVSSQSSNSASALGGRRRARGCRPGSTRCRRPSSCSRPRQMRFDSIMSGTSAGSRPCCRTNPQLRPDCSPAISLRSTSTTPHAAAGKVVGGRAADDAAADHDDVRTRAPSVGRAHASAAVLAAAVEDPVDRPARPPERLAALLGRVVIDGRSRRGRGRRRTRRGPPRPRPSRSSTSAEHPVGVALQRVPPARRRPETYSQSWSPGMEDEHLLGRHLLPRSVAPDEEGPPAPRRAAAEEPPRRRARSARSGARP